jgi:hypothetical protein
VHGQAPKVGVSLHYARADHTHGTPPLPDLDGDVQGPIGNTWVDALQGVKLLAASPLVNGQVLTVQGGHWVPKALPPPPPLPALGGDLSGPIADASVDKLQGVPLVNTSPLVNGHVLTVQAGRWVPKALPPAPPPPTPAPLPALAGDVTGAITGNTIGELQGVPVKADSPKEGEVLYFDGDEWVPNDVSAALQFVGRGTALPYQIIAAAEVSLRAGSESGVSVQIDHRYGELDIDKAGLDGASMARIEFLVGAPDADQFTGYDVKLTPIFLKSSFQLYLGDRVKQESATRIRVVVLVAAGKLDPNGTDFAFQMEISRYGEKPHDD